MKTVPSLKDTSMFFLASRPEAFPPSALPLLPLNIRRDLLCLLPAVDLWRLETYNRSTLVVDTEEVWRERIATHILPWTCGIDYKELSTARESYLNHACRVAILSSSPGSGSLRSSSSSSSYSEPVSKWCYFSFLLHGVVSARDLTQWRFRPFYFDESCLLPPHLRLFPRSDRSAGNTVFSLSYLAQASSWRPRRLEVCVHEHLDPGLLDEPAGRSLREFLCELEEVCLALEGDEVTADVMAALSLLQGAAAASRRLHTVEVAGTLVVLDYLVSKMAKYYGQTHSYRHQKSQRRSSGKGSSSSSNSNSGSYTKLKRLKLTRTIPPFLSSLLLVTVSDPGDEWGVLLSQEALQELELANFRDDFPEVLANFLPHLLASSPSLHCLALPHCHIPRNSFEALLNTYLHSPTQHTQILDLGTTMAGDDSHKTFSFMQNSPLHPILNHQLSTENLKTLCIPFSPSGVGGLTWLLSASQPRLRRLHLTLWPLERDLQRLCRALEEREGQEGRGILPLEGVSVCLYHSAVLSWSHRSSAGVQRLSALPVVREVTVVGAPPEVKMTVLYREAEYYTPHSGSGVNHNTL